MSGPESVSANFVVDDNVRNNAQNFSGHLSSDKGPVTGFPGPSTGVEAAAGNPGSKLVMTGGNGNSRPPAEGPDYHAFVNSQDLQNGVYANNYAPVVVENNNRPIKQSGGKKRRKNKHSKKVKKHHKKSKRHAMKSKRHTKRHTKRHAKKLMKKRKTMKKGMLTNLKKLLGMKGGNPATFTPNPSVANDRQYMNNQEFTNSYKQGGHLDVKLSALANPTLTTPTNNC